MEKRGVAPAEDEELVVDVQLLFREFDRRFFHSRLSSRVRVGWSNSLRRETGECVVRSRREGGGVFVYLSEPILRYRTKADIVDALLARHEMVHAYLYVTHDKDWTGHGQSFLNLSQTINKLEGTNVQPYHQFKEEVEFLQTSSSGTISGTNDRRLQRTSMSPKPPAGSSGNCSSATTTIRRAPCLDWQTDSSAAGAGMTLHRYFAVAKRKQEDASPNGQLQPASCAVTIDNAPQHTRVEGSPTGACPVCRLSFEAITESALPPAADDGEAAILAHVGSCLQSRQPALLTQTVHPTTTLPTTTGASPPPPED